MTNRYLRNITADYITGVVSACEGIRDSLVLINGPLGCKFYHGYASGQSVIKSSELWRLRGELQLSDAMNDQLLRSQYFAGTPQIPGTNLRYEDFIFGTREQLRRALNDMFSERRYALFTVIQAPGTSLLGEALEGELQEISREYDIPYLFVETPQFSENLFLGYDAAMVRLLRQLTAPPTARRADRTRPCVNLFGFYTYARYLEGDVSEVTRLLDLCGIDVNCVAGANCTMEAFRHIPEADANLFFSPERCTETTKFLREAYGMPELDLGGMPVGFDLTERFVRAAAELLHTDCTPALEDIERARARAFYFVGKHMGSGGFPRDLRYAAEGEWSALYGYVDYLSGYLGIAPAAIHPLYTQCGGDGEARLTGLLEQLGLQGALEADFARVHDAIVLGSANSIAEILAYSGNIFGIETMLPASGYVHVLPKTLLGCTGALFLLEQVLNGARLLNAWN